MRNSAYCWLLLSEYNRIEYIKHNYRLDVLQDQRFRQFLNYVVKVSETSPLY